MATILEQYRIADFLEWNREKKLFLNPEFQRGSVWTPAARVYLIDTILREYPIPKIYIRTTVDLATKKSVREVVDGQQRLRAIIDFAEDRIRLTKRAGEYVGLTYSSLNQEDQETFLSYPISVGQLLNASDDDVLEVFSRLNSYSVQLNAAEKRHARYSGEFKWAVRQASRRWAILWDRYRVVSVRERVRMLDDSLMAEMFGVLLNGITDGGQSRIDKLYAQYDKSFDPEEGVPEVIDKVLDFFVKNIADQLSNTPLLNSPHFLMLFGALSHAMVGIPQGALTDAEFPNSESTALQDLDTALANLTLLASVIDSEKPPDGFDDFWRASTASTQRIASRRIRFPVFCQALLPDPL